MDRKLAKHLVKNLKIECPVPPETCPMIDDLIKMVKRYMPSKFRAQQVIDKLEQLRKDNRDLRELGREWYQLADDLSHQFPASQDVT